MIVVVGSRHDPVAHELVAEWPHAALCDADDLTRPGWVWSPTGAAPSQWMVAGAVVADLDVTGVFLRRAAFYPEEFEATHPDDRGYLAAEAHAFMADVLASTVALVANPVADGTFGDEVIRPDRWMRAAAEVGLPVAPIRLRSEVGPIPTRRVNLVEVVGAGVLGSAPPRTLAGVQRLARTLRMPWATVLLDGRHRVLTVTTVIAPSGPARQALGAMLTSGEPR